MKGKEPRKYEEKTKINFLGKEVYVLDLSREFKDGVTVYPGHMKTASWMHLSHEECKLNLGDETDFEGYAVKGFASCDHTGTHVDAVYHFRKDRPDLTVDQIPFEYLITPAAWIDLSFVPPRTNISLDNVKEALAKAEVELKEGMSLLCYTGVAEKWDEPGRFLTQYAGFGREASEYILDQGVVNVCTDAASTDNPADKSYHNHSTHAEYMRIHTEVVNNINKIPRYKDFYYAMFPLRFVGGTGFPVRAVAMWDAE